MIRKSKLALIAAVAAAGVAAPALAQSFDPDAGTSNLVGANAASAMSQTIVAPPTSGLRAYGMVPRTATAPAGAADSALTDPALNGGGSTGYNEMLLQY
jgi:hypothetical protein